MDAPAAALWDLIEDFGAPQKLAASIERCEMTGTGVGAVRTVHARGLVIREQLLEADAVARRLRYEILPGGDMPAPGMSRYVATVVLTSLSPTTTKVEWSSEGEVDSGLSAAGERLTQLYRGAISNLRKLTAPQSEA